MEIKEIKIQTLQAYADVLRAQSCGKKDKFIDGLKCAYSLTLEKFGYSDRDLDSIEFVHHEVERLEKQDIEKQDIEKLKENFRDIYWSYHQRESKLSDTEVKKRLKEIADILEKEGIKTI